MIIRDITKDDFENLYNFISAFPITFGYDKETILSLYDDESIIAYIAEKNNTPKAFLLGKIVTPIFNNNISIGWVFAIYGNGYATTLIRKFRAHLKTLEIKYMSIGEHTNSPSSITKLYKRLKLAPMQTVYCGEI